MELRAAAALWVLCGFLLQPGRAERPPGSHLDETAIAGTAGPGRAGPGRRGQRAARWGPVLRVGTGREGTGQDRTGGEGSWAQVPPSRGSPRGGAALRAWAPRMKR